MGPRVLTSQQRRIALTMALLGSVLPIVIVTVDGWGEHRAYFWVGAAVAVLAPIGSILSPPANRWLRWPFAFSGLPALTLLQAYTGGVASPNATLLVMGMFWFGLMASDLELRIGLVVIVACCLLPMLLVGAPAYPLDPARAAALILVDCSVMLAMAASTRETVKLTRRLRHDANHDRLTHLLNRRGWDDAVDEIMCTPRVEPTRFVVALIDLDQLKRVNDTAGHQRGDALLFATAENLERHFAAPATVARLGGDEFACLVVDGSVEDVVAMLDDMRTDAGPDGAFSAGVAEVMPGEGPGEVTRRADLALYEAKATGRNRTCLATMPLPAAMEVAPKSADRPTR